MGSVADTYDQDREREWRRLEGDAYHSLEFLTTMHYVRRHLPAQGRVLDAGGGPGRYAVALCRLGYEVVLMDISAVQIDVAREKIAAEPKEVRQRLLDAAVGDIRDLSRFDTELFDAVLCLGGPLTHVPDSAGRSQAMTELVRVCKPGAIVATAVVGYLAVLRTVLAEFSHELTTTFRELADRGNSLVKGNVWHFFRASELKALAESCGLETLEMVGCQGLSTGLAEATNAVAEDPAKWAVWEELVVQTATEPAVVDMAEHILHIGRKPTEWRR